MPRPPVRSSLAVVLALALAACGGAASNAGPPVPRIGGCPIFPASNPWNRDVSRAPVSARSRQYIHGFNRFGRTHLYAAFGHGIYGIDYSVVPANQPLVPIRFVAEPRVSDPGPYPVPTNPKIEHGPDHHVLFVQQGTCRLYELYRAQPGPGRWLADAGAVFDLRSNRLRPEGWTSADAAGLPILPGLVRYDEVAAGAINHTLRVTAAMTARGWVYPARHYGASAGSAPDLPPMGLRMRLRRSFSLRGFHGQALVILRALKRYGMMVADAGESWGLVGTPDPRWNDADLAQLQRVPGSAFVALRHGPVHTAS
jgi:hypothetical protein